MTFVNVSPTPTPVEIIRDTFAQQRRKHQARHRDIATQLGISECALIAAHTGPREGTTEGNICVTRLRPDWRALIDVFTRLGRVMALTRNHACVQENLGRYHIKHQDERVVQVWGGGIDVELQHHRWTHGFAVEETTAQGVQRSVQFFDGAGDAVHKVFLKADSDLVAFEALIAQFAHRDQTPQVPIHTSVQNVSTTNHPTNPWDLLSAWQRINTPDDFWSLVATMKLNGQEALRLVENQYAWQVTPDVCRLWLQEASEQSRGICVATGNTGAKQRHSGVVKRIVDMGPWLNVLDPDFNLHLRTDLICGAWQVTLPAADPHLTWLALFDDKEHLITSFLGEFDIEVSTRLRESVANRNQEADACRA